MPLLRLNAVFYDLNLLYDFCVLVTRDQHLTYRFDQYFWRRNGRPLAENERLFLRSLRYGSPVQSRFGITQAVAISGTLWVLVQAVERVVMLGPNRELVRAQTLEALASAAKLRADADEVNTRLGTMTPTLDSVTARRGEEARRTLDTLLNRMRSQHIEIDALRIYAIPPEPPTLNEQSDPAP